MTLISKKQRKARLDELIESVKPKASAEYETLMHKLTSVDNYNCAENPEHYIDAPEDVSDETAELLCWQCPAIRECYIFAVKEGVDYGVWGGINFTSSEQKENCEQRPDELPAT